MIHTRAAEDDTFAILRERAAGLTVILHCFSAPDRLEECVERGYCCSFAGNVTYTKATDLQEAARDVPDELLLVETDSPYLAPQPVRGKPNEPANVVAHRASSSPTCAASCTRSSSERSSATPRGSSAGDASDAAQRAGQPPPPARSSTCGPNRELGQNFLIDDNILRRDRPRRRARPGGRRARGRRRPRRAVGVPRPARRPPARGRDRPLARAGAARRARPVRTTPRCTSPTPSTLDLAALEPPPTKVVANLPYGVAATVLLRTVEELPEARSGVAMVQREVGERLAAAPGSKIYGATSVLAQLACEVRWCARCRATVFHPVPNVSPRWWCCAATRRRRRARSSRSCTPPSPTGARRWPARSRSRRARPTGCATPPARRWSELGPARRRPRRAALAAGRASSTLGRAAAAADAMIRERAPRRSTSSCTSGRAAPTACTTSARCSPRSTSPTSVTLRASDAGADAVVCPGVDGREPRRRRAARLPRRASDPELPAARRVRSRSGSRVAAGLGGGSADAAAALRAANALAGDRSTPAALRELAAGLGADVPSQIEPAPRARDGRRRASRAARRCRRWRLALAAQPARAVHGRGVRRGRPPRHPRASSSSQTACGGSLPARSTALAAAARERPPARRALAAAGARRRHRRAARARARWPRG